MPLLHCEKPASGRTVQLVALGDFIHYFLCRMGVLKPYAKVCKNAPRGILSESFLVCVWI